MPALQSPAVPSRARPAPRGFTLVEMLMVVVVVGLLAVVALPRMDFARYRADAAARTVATTLSYAQRLAVSRQANVNVGFDAARRGLRIHEDRNNDLVLDPGERVTFTPLDEGATFGRGSAAARPFGSGAIELTRTQAGLPVVTFRRDGSASEAGGLYVTTVAGLAADRITDVRAVEIARATGRATWFTYATSTWKRGD